MVIEWSNSASSLQYQNELCRSPASARVSPWPRIGRDAELRLSLDAFEDEINLLIDRAALQNERGRA
jgi:hypothetical protein